ncbi:50S ribosomal protein L30 [soil metagenome]
MLKITQVKSTIDRLENQKRTMIALGITKMHRSVVKEDNPAIRGMIRTVSHLVKVETV